MDLRLNTGYKQILGMALPISFAILVPQINFITNTIFLGSLGQQSLASAGITGVYYLIFAVIGNGLNNGLQTLIARKAGENNPKEIGHLFFHGVWISLAISLIGIFLTYNVAPFILKATIHNEIIYQQVVSFNEIRIWGLPMLYLYGMRNALLVGINQTKLLIWGTLAETVFNIFFDYALIYGHFGFPAVGFNGAAFASILSEGAGLLVIFIVIHFNGLNRTFALFENKKINLDTIRHILYKSSPLILQYSLSIITWEYFYILIEHHGDRALAVSNTMRNIFGIFGVFSWAFAATTNTMVSNVIGQQKQEEVLPLIRRIVKLSVLCCGVLTVFLNIRPEVLLSFYGQGGLFIADGIAVVRVVSVALIVMSFSAVWLNSVTGTGNTMVNLTIEVITLAFYIIYTYLVLEVWNLPITWGWVSELVYWVGMFSMSFWYMKSGRWKKNFSHSIFLQMDLNIKDKRALVCGSTQGIGKASAIELAQLGASITLLARNENKLKSVLAELPASQEQKHNFLVADFNFPDQVKSAIEKFVSMNEIHILINNTGGPPAGQAIDARPEDFLSAIHAHLIVSQILVQACVPAMKRNNFGRIINIISTSVKIPIKGLGVSNTVRGAMASWSKTLSLELAPFGITVNNVLPGSTKTGRIESLIQTRSQKTGRSPEEIRQEMIDEIPAGRMAEASEVAAAVAFFASPAAGYINGVSLPVDGGRTGSL